jgi:hypothetical protein
MIDERVEQAGRPPRQRGERSVIKLCAAQPNQVGAVRIRGGPQHGAAVIELSRDRLPIDVVQARAITSYGNDVFVPGRERIGKSVSETGAKAVAPLLSVINLDNGQSARLYGAVGVAIQRTGHFAIRGPIARHEPLRPPLVLRAVAEEQNGGM